VDFSDTGWIGAWSRAWRKFAGIGDHGIRDLAMFSPFRAVGKNGGIWFPGRCPGLGCGAALRFERVAIKEDLP